MRLASPEFLWLLLLLPVIVWIAPRGLVFRSRARGGRYSSLVAFAPVRTTLRARLRVLPNLLLACAFALIVLALARPQTASGEKSTTTRGVAMMVVVDRSGSMREGMMFEGQSLRRIDVVRRVFAEFVLGNAPVLVSEMRRELQQRGDPLLRRGDAEAVLRARAERSENYLAGRPDDLIGLVTFALWAETVAPLSPSHDPLVHLAESVEPADPRSREAMTAIGEGLALAAARLERAEENLARSSPDLADNFEIKSKAIVLLTDGDENAGNISATAAAERCAEFGIKVYVVGIGDPPAPRRRRSVMDLAMQQSTLNEPLLNLIADRTGGMYRRAADGESLRAIYKEIDELEKTEIETTEYTSYEEHFAVLAAAALAGLLLSSLLDATLFRRTP